MLIGKLTNLQLFYFHGILPFQHQLIFRTMIPASVYSNGVLRLHPFQCEMSFIFIIIQSLSSFICCITEIIVIILYKTLIFAGTV